MFRMSFLVTSDCSIGPVLGCSRGGFGDSTVSTGDAGETGMTGGLGLGLLADAMFAAV